MARVWLRFALVLLALSLLLCLPAASAQTQANVQGQIEAAFSAVHAAEAEGGNVTSLVTALNQAINLTETADALNATNPQAAAPLYAEASALATSTLANASREATIGKSAEAASTVRLYEETAVFGVLAAAVYFVTPVTYWTVWTRVHRRQRVKPV